MEYWSAVRRRLKFSISPVPDFWHTVMVLSRIAMALVVAGLTVRAQDNVLRWRPTAALESARANACAVRMADGKVLITGGSAGEGPLHSVELFRVAPEEKFETVAPMLSARAGHACVLLGDGRVLVAGGGPGDASAAEIYDPGLRDWTAVASIVSLNRGAGVTATLLPDGRVLLAGGALGQLEMFDPDTNELRLLPVSLSTLRKRHTATLLADGRVLIAGGIAEGTSLSTVELFDPSSSTLKAGASLSAPRSGHTATLLPDTRVLIVGGVAGTEERAELEVFEAGADIFTTLEARLQQPREGHIAVLLETNGSVLIAGGAAAGQALASSEVFEPWDNRIVPAGSLTAPRVAIAGIALEDGRVLALGGRNADGASRACGVLAPVVSFSFTQARYRPLERASIQGSVGVALPAPITLPLTLQRVNLTTGATVSASERLLAQTITVPVSGNLPVTAVMNVTRDDIGNDFVLRVGRETAAQSRFGVRLSTAVTLTHALPVIAGSPVRSKLVLTADGAPVNMSGTSTLAVGARSSASVSVSNVTASATSDYTICCESAPGVVQASGRFSGNVFLEPASTAGSIVIGSPTPTIRIVPVNLRLQQAGQILVEVVFDPASIDPNDLPRGTVRLSKNGAAIATSPLSNNLAVGLGVPRGALFAYTPSAADRRTTPCFDAQFTGDNRYTTVSSSSTCLAIGPATTALQVSMGASTVYTLGEIRTLTAQLTWPDSVGIVGRAVVITAGGQPVATINLVPDPTGKGMASGSTPVRLPFLANALTAFTFTYPQSGDLSQTAATIRPIMSPVSTTTSVTVFSPTSNPFFIRYTIRINTGGVSLPAGTSLGGAVEIFDGTELLGTQPVPPLPGGTTFTDGSSNTIIANEPTVSVSGSLGNVIRPLGIRNIRVRYSGGLLFLGSEGTAAVSVQ